MNADKYKEILEKVSANFEILNQEHFKDEDRKEEFEITEFNGPAGKIKLEWITRPKVLDKKTSYSNRIGSDVSVTTVYSEEEVTHTFKVYKWDDEEDEWEEINAESFL